jgi:hypothetical protein
MPRPFQQFLKKHQAELDRRIKEIWKRKGFPDMQITDVHRQTWLNDDEIYQWAMSTGDLYSKKNPEKDDDEDEEAKCPYCDVELNLITTHGGRVMEYECPRCHERWDEDSEEIKANPEAKSRYQEIQEMFKPVGVNQWGENIYPVDLTWPEIMDHKFIEQVDDEYYKFLPHYNTGGRYGPRNSKYLSISMEWLDKMLKLYGFEKRLISTTPVKSYNVGDDELPEWVPAYKSQYYELFYGDQFVGTTSYTTLTDTAVVDIYVWPIEAVKKAKQWLIDNKKVSDWNALRRARYGNPAKNPEKLVIGHLESSKDDIHIMIKKDAVDGIRSITLGTTEYLKIVVPKKDLRKIVRWERGVMVLGQELK